MTFVTIADLRHHVGLTVSVRGWVSTTRSSGKIAFLVLRDGSGYLQAVFPKNEVAIGAWERFGTLTHEACVTITGTVREDARAPGGFELTASDVIVTSPSVDFPITPKEHGTAFLFEHRHLWLRSKKQVAIARVRNEVEHAIADFFYAQRLHSRGHADPHGLDRRIRRRAVCDGLFRPGEGVSRADGPALCRGRSRRARQGLLLWSYLPGREVEDAPPPGRKTWMCEPEVAFADNDDNMRLQEEFVSYLVGRTLERRKEELKELEQDLAPLEKITTPFPRLTYTEAIARLQAAGSDIQWGTDLGADDETALAQAYDRPLFVMNYPKAVKAFYMKENPDDPRTVLSNDCLAPEGYGEIIGGSQREEDYDSAARPDSSHRGWIRRATAGISTSGNTADFRIPDSDSDSSVPSPGSAAFRIFAKPSHFPGRFTDCIRKHENREQNREQRTGDPVSEAGLVSLRPRVHRVLRCRRFPGSRRALWPTARPVQTFRETCDCLSQAPFQAERLPSWPS